MKILVVADIHGNLKNLNLLLEKIEKEKLDLIIIPGDFTDLFADYKDFDQLDVAEMLIQKFLSLKTKILCIPGNNDPYDMVYLFDEYGVNLHEKVVEHGGLDFAGFGGAKTPFATNFEPTDDEFKAGLAKIEKQLKGKFVFVSHAPPKDTKLDKVKAGDHVGSQIIKDFIVKHKPILAISAHILEARGEDKLGETKLFYPGALTEGYYGLVNLDKEIKCEIKNLKE